MPQSAFVLAVMYIQIVYISNCIYLYIGSPHSAVFDCLHVLLVQFCDSLFYHIYKVGRHLCCCQPAQLPISTRGSHESDSVYTEIKATAKSDTHHIKTNAEEVHHLVEQLQAGQVCSTGSAAQA